MRLADALGMAADEVVALVGGGGKTTAMFRLAREMAGAGGSAITTTTTHISDDILPALRKAGVSEDQIEQMLVGNPRVIFEVRKPGSA